MDPYPFGMFSSGQAGKVPGGLGTVPILFTPTLLSSNTLLPPHRHSDCCRLSRGYTRQREGGIWGSTLPNSGKGCDLGQKTSVPGVPATLLHSQCHHHAEVVAGHRVKHNI